MILVYDIPILVALRELGRTELVGGDQGKVTE
jgi:hypothetical protein